MKIIGYEFFDVAPNWQFLKIETDDGPSGWGESTLEGQSGAVAATLRDCFDYLIGQDPTRISAHWRVLAGMEYYRGGPVLRSAVAGIDQALWDILGKSLDVPISALLGGAIREKIRVYGQAHGASPSEVGESVRRAAETGFTAVKVGCAAGPFEPLATPREVDDLLARLDSARAAAPRIDLALDLHGRPTLSDARRILPLLDPFRMMFVEEPVGPDDFSRSAELRHAGATPIAMGERLYELAEFSMAAAYGVSVLQPDVSHVGGISELMRVESVAQATGRLLAPHCPLGPIALAACLQIDANAPSFLIQEQVLTGAYGVLTPFADYLIDTTPFSVEDGWIAVPSAPGLGVHVDEPAVRRASAMSEPWSVPRLVVLMAQAQRGDFVVGGGYRLKRVRAVHHLV